MNHVTYSVSSTDISVFLQEISNFAMSRNTDFFFESLKIVLINVVTVLMISRPF